jgi:hypothetical protein
LLIYRGVWSVALIVPACRLGRLGLLRRVLGGNESAENYWVGVEGWGAASRARSVAWCRGTEGAAGRGAEGEDILAPAWRLGALARRVRRRRAEGEKIFSAISKSR